MSGFRRLLAAGTLALAAALTLSGCSSAADSGPVTIKTKTPEQAVEKWLEAQERGDTETLAALTTPPDGSDWSTDHEWANAWVAGIEDPEIVLIEETSDMHYARVRWTLDGSVTDAILHIKSRGDQGFFISPQDKEVLNTGFSAVSKFQSHSTVSSFQSHTFYPGTATAADGEQWPATPSSLFMFPLGVYEYELTTEFWGIEGSAPVRMVVSDYGIPERVKPESIPFTLSAAAETAIEQALTQLESECEKIGNSQTGNCFNDQASRDVNLSVIREGDFEEDYEIWDYIGVTEDGSPVISLRGEIFPLAPAYFSLDTGSSRLTPIPKAEAELVYRFTPLS